MTTLVCRDCKREHKGKFTPTPEDKRCSCGGQRVLPSQIGPRTELQSVSDKRMEAEGERLVARGSTLRPGRRKALSLKEFWMAVTDEGTSGCALAYVGGCYGKLDPHHYIPQQRLKRCGFDDKTLAAVLTDPRNGVPLCRYHHERVENANDPLETPRPLDLDEFLADYGISEAGRLAA